MGSRRWTQISDLPGAVLTSIIGLVSDPRTRNNMSIACREWYYLERQTRPFFSLRGNVCDMVTLPVSFTKVTSLDLSHCSPWGYSVFQSSTDGELVGQTLRDSFPNVKDLAIYVRDAVDIQMVAWIWPKLESVRLVRWHQRAIQPGDPMDLGAEVEAVFKCEGLLKLDLSKFYCWTEDIPPALKSSVAIAQNLRSLNLLKISPEGFRTQEIEAITSVCRNLEELFLLCEFDPRYLDSVGDHALSLISSNCTGLRVLHLVDSSEWGKLREYMDDNLAAEDANVTNQGLEGLFKSLAHLQELAFLVGQNIRNSGPALQSITSHCPKLRILQLSNFHSVCSGPQDGLSLCSGLTDLSLKNCSDLTDSQLLSIANGCKQLRKLGLKCCREISEMGLGECVRTLSKTLVDVEISGCRRLPTAETLRALETIRETLQVLHIDCVWDDNVVEQDPMTATVASHSQTSVFSGASGGGPLVHDFDLNVGADEAEEFTSRTGKFIHHRGAQYEGHGVPVSSEVGKSVANSLKQRVLIHESSGGASASTGEWWKKHPSSNDGSWSSLHTLSVWISVGKLISCLPSKGLLSCPTLKLMSIKVEGDCASQTRPRIREWGLSSLQRYKSLSTLSLDLSDMIGFSLTVIRIGQVDLDWWERFYLNGIRNLQLWELKYRPPCDKDMNRRRLSLPAAGLLSESSTLRKLFVHGTAHEHWLDLLQRISNLRDFQLRWDYFPGPEYETSTELRTESCRRFEEALRERGFPD